MKTIKTYKNETLDDIELNDEYEELELINCKCQKIDLTKAKLNYFEISESLIESSNFANLDLREKTIIKTTFKNCNFLGTNLSGAYLKDIIFENCNFTYANFSTAHLEKITFYIRM